MIKTESFSTACQGLTPFESHEGFFELGLSPWDIAAGSLIIEEAGGVITDFDGGDDYLSTGNIVAGNRAIHPELLKEVQAVFGGIIDK